jgi:hypothetical protein
MSRTIQIDRELEMVRRLRNLEENFLPYESGTPRVRHESAVAAGSTSFTGTAYVAGRKTTGLGTKAWVRVFLDSATAEDHDGPPPDPFPPNEEWYEVAQTFGNIHVPRA